MLQRACLKGNMRTCVGKSPGPILSLLPSCYSWPYFRLALALPRENTPLKTIEHEYKMHVLPGVLLSEQVLLCAHNNPPAQ